MKKSKQINKFLCPVCGRFYVDEYDICECCGWENDPVQFQKPDFQGGANEMSLNQAKNAYQTGRPVR